jgi:hypothetical protein
MIRRICRYPRILTFFTVSLGLCTFAEANVVPDASFENGTANWSLQDNTSAIIGSPTRTGTKALKMINVGNGVDSPSHYAQQNSITGITPGQEYYYSVWVSGNNLVGVGDGGKPLAIVRWRDGNKKIILASDGRWKESFLWAPYGTYGFRQMTMVLQAPSNASFVDMVFRTWWGCTGGESYWDDVALTVRDFSGRGNLLATYQAEDASTKSGGSVKSEKLDYTGTGYYDVTTNGAILEWTNVSGGGDRVLSFRYSWEGNVRDLELFVNGISRGKHRPLPTGRRGIWASDIWNVNLPAGTNTIRLKIGKTGGLNSQPMFDKLDVHAVGGGTQPPPPPSPPGSAPGNVMASDDAFTDRVAVSWNAVSGATYYEVYRSTAMGNNGSRIASPTGTSYNDTGANAGTTYYYSAKACNTAGCSGFSAQDAGRREAAAVQNQSPRVELAASQNGSITRWVTVNDGNVQVSATITDPNAGDAHTFDWSASDNMLVPLEGFTSSTFTFDPLSLTPGLYVVRVSVADNGTPAKSSSSELMLRVASSLPMLSNTTDSDNDSVDDATEGYVDSDNDGIPDYQDAVNQATQLQGKPLEGTTYLLQTEGGLELKLGHTAFAAGKSAAAVSLQDIAAYGGSGGVAAQNSEDSGFDYPVGIYDFEIGNLPQPGRSIKVVIPQQGVIPTGAAYRKYTPSGWQGFVIDQANSVASAPGQPGTCPPPGDAAYVPGLTGGHFCVQLTIEDGGPNDADGVANSSVSDPGGVATTTSSSANTAASGSGGGGCSFNNDPKNNLVIYLLVALSFLYLVVGRRFRINED